MKLSLYNILFGENEDAMALLGMISCTRNIFQRYRDVYLNKEGTIITVLTRIGGANRKDYKQVFKDIKRNPYYIRNYDDNFDNTYCYFEFKVPDKYKFTCYKMRPKKDRPSVSDMFKQEIKDAEVPGSEASKRMEKLAEQIFNNMDDGGNGEIHIIRL
jgi:hypothetical protein